MRKFLFTTLLTVLLISIQVSAQSPQDTVYIPGTQSLQISAIINADTTAPEERVYVLDRGAIYYIELAFELNSSRKFIAKGDENERPPVLCAAVRGDGSSEEWFFKMNKEGMTLELNDLYILSMRWDGATLGWSRAIAAWSNNISIILRNVVFDAFTECALKVQADYVSLDVQNCHFRNFIHSTSYFGGQPFLSDGGNKPGVTIIKNNTFFACQSYLLSVRGLGEDVVFEHNSVVYGVVNPMLTRQADDLYIKNNLFYAAHAWGGDPEQTMGGWFLNYPDSVSTSIYRARMHMTWGPYEVSGPEALNDTAAGLIFDPATWTHDVQYNDCYFPDALVDFYTNWNDTVTLADSVTFLGGYKDLVVRKLNMPRWINDLTAAVIDSVTNPASENYSPNFVVAHNIALDPQFEDAGVVGHIDELIAYVDRIASRTLDNPWHYELNFPPVWPIPENLRYTNEVLKTAGSDGLPLGDLNWFPEVMALEKVETGSGLPTKFAITKNYPNPFNPSTTIEFTIGKAAHTKLAIYNIVGQKVKTLYDQEFKQGTYKATWNGVDDYGQAVASGMYFIILESDGFVASKKVLLIK